MRDIGNTRVDDSPQSLAAVYLRVSSREQRLRQTITTQRDFADRYCTLHGIPVHDRYADDGVSGTVPFERRPAGRRLLEDAERHLFDTILVYRIDRLARNTLELLHIVEILERAGVKVLSMSELVETGTRTGRLVLSTLGSIAELERDSIAERSSLGHRCHAREGRWSGGVPPLGYRLGLDGRLEISPSEAEFVRNVFRLYLGEGATGASVADHLNALGRPIIAEIKGIKKHTSGRWTGPHVVRLLRNPVYTGKYTFGKVQEVTQGGLKVRLKVTASERLVEFPVPPIIDEETFETVQQKLSLWKTHKDGSRPSRQSLLLGLVRCAHCGGAFVCLDRNSAGPVHRPYYQCWRRWRISATPDLAGGTCRSRSVRADVLEQIVWQDISSFVRNPGVILAQYATWFQRQGSLALVSDGLYEFSLDLEGRLENAIESTQPGCSCRDGETESRLRLLGQTLEAWKERKNEIFARIHWLQAMQHRLIRVAMLLHWIRAIGQQPDFSTRRAIVGIVVDRIRVTTVEEHGKAVPEIDITYCFEPHLGLLPADHHLSGLPIGSNQVLLRPHADSSGPPGSLSERLLLHRCLSAAELQKAATAMRIARRRQEEHVEGR